MEGRYSRGILLAITYCKDPSAEEEFNYWYNHMHLHDVTAPGVYSHAARFVNTNPKPGEGKYIALYETDLEDLSAAWASDRENSASLRAKGRYSPHLGVVFGAVFKKLGGEFHAASRPVRGILVALTNCKDPAREEEFNRWYTDVHIPDILDSGLYHAAYR